MAKFLDENGLSYFYGKLKSKFSNYVYVGTNPPANLPVNAIWINPSEAGSSSDSSEFLIKRTDSSWGPFSFDTGEFYWKASEAVKVGDIRIPAGRANTGKILKCVQAGTTGSSQPSITSDAILADFSSVYRIGAVRWIYNIAEKDEDEILATGVAYSRSTYSALWAYAQSKSGLVITETEWQKKYTASGGKFVPYYSSGDGSSTFRTPLLAGYAKGNTDNSKIGTFKADSSAGVADLISNHYHGFGYNTANNSGSFLATSALQSFPLKPTSGSRSWNGSGGGGGYSGDVTSYVGNMITSMPLSASGSSVSGTIAINPDTMNGVWVIKAFGTIVNSNNTDLKNVLTGIESISTRMNTHESNSKFVVKTYQNRANWYRKWSDGWLEQGGYISKILPDNVTTTITLHQPMKNIDYTIIFTERADNITTDSNNENVWINSVPTTTSFSVYNSAGGYKTLFWKVEGQGA